MKLLEKVKNMFTEEIEEDEPIKKEVIQVEIKAPEKKEEPTSQTEPSTIEKTVTDNETLKKEEKFKFPVYFDDNDFDKIETRSVKPAQPPRREPPRREMKQNYNTKNGNNNASTAYGGKNPATSASVKEEKKVFKPTPIISPVYGILDKNYKKEDLTPRKRITSENYRKPKAVTVDDVRNKAFGSLEDDLEAAIFGQDSILFPEEKESQVKDNLLEDLETPPRHGKEEPPRNDSKEKKLLEEVNDLAGITVRERELEDDIMDTPLPSRSEKQETKDKNIIEEEMNKIYDNPTTEEELTESDLFNLIDSMYEKKEDE